METTSPFVTQTSAFADVLGETPSLEKVVDVEAHEGPVYAPDEHALYFTSLPPHASVQRLDLDTLEVSVVRADVNAPNGCRSTRRTTSS